MFCTQAKLDDARSALVRALAVARAGGDDDAIMHAEFVMGHVEHTVGDLKAARDCFVRSLEGFRAAGRAWGAGHVLTAMAWVAHSDGEPRESERLLSKADLVLGNAGPWFLLLGLYVRSILFDLIGRLHPPPITHPDFFYGFIEVAIVWQVAFLVIGRDPVRFHMMMVPAMLEKFVYVPSLSVLFVQGRLRGSEFVVAAPDFVLGLLFALSFARVKAARQRPRSH